LIERESGTHFDPNLAARFIQLIRGSDIAALHTALVAAQESETSLVLSRR
jgi:hypothetical protein